MPAKKKCPRCGVAVNVANLQSHIARVHPREKVEVELDLQEKAEVRRERRLRGPRSRKASMALGVAIAAVVLAVLLPSLLSSPASGLIHLDPAYYDFGEIDQVVVSTSFRIHNGGSSPLVLQGVSTSCMCTTAKVVYAGASSPEFGYHGNPSGWSLSLPPDAAASLVVTYDPTVHPERGEYVRDVYVLSSDPAHRESSVRIHVVEV